MSEKINFIPANELPVAEGDDVSYLCLEDGEMKRKPGASLGGSQTPLLLDADSAEAYQSDSSYGDAALEAIKSGRNILVRVPNADGGSYTAIYSPVLMYQLPNYQNKYLYLFFLRDEKQDLSALLGQPDGTVQMPTYGQLKMLLSQEYNSNPLES